jgi:hypothetical protein
VARLRRSRDDELIRQQAEASRWRAWTRRRLTKRDRV